MESQFQKDQKLRAGILAEQFTAEQLSGARWDVPGWDEANKKLDALGLGVIACPIVDLGPKTPKNE